MKLFFLIRFWSADFLYATATVLDISHISLTWVEMLRFVCPI